MNNPGEPRTVVLQSTPETRGACPSEWAEGFWMEVGPDVEEIQLKPTPGTPESGRVLMARPSGKVARRADLLSAPLWTVRWEKP